MWTLEPALRGWNAWLYPSWCVTAGKCLTLFMHLCWDLFLSYSLESLPLPFWSAKYSVLPFSCLEECMYWYTVANQVEDRLIGRCQRRDFQLGKVQFPQIRRKEVSRKKFYLSTYAYVGIYICVYAYYICVFVCMHVCMYTHVYIYVYCLCVHMHACACIFENTDSSYVRFQLLENGSATYYCMWKTWFSKFKIV